jgi:hypothetical protein
MEKRLKLSAKINFKVVNELSYRQLLVSIIYLTTARPDLSYNVSFISRLMKALKIEHWIAAKRVLRHLTLAFGTAKEKTLMCVYRFKLDKFCE